ncbi:MAG: alpha/beta hydrolase [Bacteroidota bacterium]
MKPFLQYQNYRIYYQIEGQGELLLFVHGWPTNSLLWKKQVAYFKANYRVLTFDWLGFGQSDKPIDYPYAFTEYKELLACLIEQLVSRNEIINLIAHDIGGPPTILWAHENQAKVKRLILLNTLIYPFSTLLDKISHRLFLIPPFQQILMSDFGLKMTMKVLSTNRGERHNQHCSEILNAHQQWSTDLRVKTILDPIKKALKKELLDLAERYQHIQSSKFLIIAKKDPLLYAHIQQLAQENPEVPQFEVPNSGHFIAIDQPDTLNQILDKILSAPAKF